MKNVKHTFTTFEVDALGHKKLDEQRKKLADLRTALLAVLEKKR